jgi:trehalose synthase
MDFMIPFILQYDAQIFTLPKYVPELLKDKNVAIIHPSIDPLSAKNTEMSDSAVLSILSKYDVEADRPIMTQVGRFDAWKDPIGAIDVYRIVKKRFPNLQLLLIGIMASDDPEGRVYLERTARHAGEDYNIHLLTDLEGVRDTEVNAFQKASDVVLQMSKREGFGLTVTEALWKGIPVVGRNVGGIPLQIIDSETGFLVNSVQEAAEKALHVFEHPEEAKRIGEKGREHVRQNFLITRHLEDYLKLFGRL